eukprot:TRINITY_DN1770_c0_g3_i2.p1 TRINITY_DN1770_c0_g3~~TRINITY_DN1770_c0_g3_i2.p1  ORF type:complete len:292 (-),score=22.45 TRINITY_DN1770_c0_g3_i2:455-1330(-)
MITQANIAHKHDSLSQTVYGTLLSVKNINQCMYDTERFHNFPILISSLQIQENMHTSQSHVHTNTAVPNGKVCPYQSGVEEKEETKVNRGPNASNGKLRDEIDSSGLVGLRSTNADRSFEKKSAEEIRRNGSKGQLTLNSNRKTSEKSSHEDLRNQLDLSNNDSGTKIVIKKQTVDKRPEEGKMKLALKRRVEKSRKGLGKTENIHSGAIKEKVVKSKRVTFKPNRNGLSKIKVDKRDPGLLCLNKKHFPSSNTSYRKNLAYSSLSSKRNSHSEMPSQSNTRPASSLQKLG